MKFTITFGGPAELITLAAQANGWDGTFETLEDGIEVSMPCTGAEFIAKLLLIKNVYDIVETALIFMEKKYGTDNYDINAQRTAMRGLITINIAE